MTQIGFTSRVAVLILCMILSQSPSAQASTDPTDKLHDGPWRETLGRRVTPDPRQAVLRTFRAPEVFIEYKEDRAPTREEYAADSEALFGRWRWEDIYGGYGAGVGVRSPDSAGCFRLLDLRRDATYTLKRKGCADSLLLSGPFSIHPSRFSHIEDGPRADLWLDLEGWGFWGRGELIAFLDPATIVMYPGSETESEIMDVSDASKSRFVRETDDKVTVTSDTSDTPALVGAWRWTRSYGSWGADIRPPSTGWARYLYFPGDRTYSFWEEDSVRNYFLGGGGYSFHAMGTARRRPWIELQDWQGAPADRWVQFLGRDTLTFYPGGGDRVVSDDNYDVFVRDREKMAPVDDRRGAKISWKPPRLWQYAPGLYGTYLPTAFVEARGGIGRLSEWRDLAYDFPHCRYTNNQIPSAVIGDFDGDSLADVAIHGFDGSWEKVVCLLSSHRRVLAYTIFQQPLAPGAARPSVSLELCPAGNVVEGPGGKAIRLETDGIRVTPRSGESEVYYFWRGAPQQGRIR